MILSPMRFKDYVWPHNPHSYSILFQRDVALHKVPLGAYTLQALGRSNRILRGEGEFAGDEAYDHFKRLATVFYGNSPGVLVHPVWQESLALFTRLSLQQEPTRHYVRYAFEFWECCEEYAAQAVTLTAESESSGSPGNSPSASTAARKKAGIHYVVAEGDSLWVIAQRNGLSLEQLLRLNPQIRNPNLISPGESILVTGEEALA